jgi:serine phosphatase RsbU (regulator of sigma subunit)
MATLAIFIRELIRDRRDKQRMAAELAASRAVQQVLIPEDVPAISGFKIQSVYKPFGEVGGDFFQVLPVKSDKSASGVLVIIGDVSGKGMPAAMTVSLLVGTVRTLAHYTQSPAEILAAMNQRMLARSHGGFTTCLALRVDADGKLTIANAGHIAPDVDGKELQLENGLPLGISADSVYAESTFNLALGQQLTLLTDGVIEARDEAGANLPPPSALTPPKPSPWPHKPSARKTTSPSSPSRAPPPLSETSGSLSPSAPPQGLHQPQRIHIDDQIPPRHIIFRRVR